jgi:hypothetical protein
MTWLVCVLTVAGTLDTPVMPTEARAPVQVALALEDGTPPAAAEPPVPEAAPAAPIEPTPPAKEFAPVDPDDPPAHNKAKAKRHKKASRDDDEESGDDEEDEDDPKAGRADPMQGAGITGGITAATAVACGLVPGTFCAACSPGCGTCCAGLGSSAAITAGAAAGSAVADFALGGGNIQPMRLALAAAFAGGAALAGAVVGTFIAILGVAVVSTPIYLVTNDSAALYVSAAIAGAVLGFVLFGVGAVVTAGAGAGGYYVGTLVE